MRAAQGIPVWSTRWLECMVPLWSYARSATEIVVTVGATEGIFATIQALVDPGDEVILIEPFYDSYPAAVVMAGGFPVYVPLRVAAGAATSAEWTLDLDELAAAFTPCTRLLILEYAPESRG